MLAGTQTDNNDLLVIENELAVEIDFTSFDNKISKYKADKVRSNVASYEFLGIDQRKSAKSLIRANCNHDFVQNQF